MAILRGHLIENGTLEIVKLRGAQSLVVGDDGVHKLEIYVENENRTPYTMLPHDITLAIRLEKDGDPFTTLSAVKDTVLPLVFDLPRVYEEGDYFIQASYTYQTGALSTFLREFTYEAHDLHGTSIAVPIPIYEEVYGRLVPTGGGTNQVIIKNSDVEGDYDWADLSATIAVTSVNGKAGDVVLTTDDIAEGTIEDRKWYTSVEQTKLAGIEAGAETNNLTDAEADELTGLANTGYHWHDADRHRSNHSGTQLSSTISDFDNAVATNVKVVANEANLNANTANIAINTVDIADIKVDVADNETAITTNSANIGLNTAKITGIEADITALETEVGGYTADITALQAEDVRLQGEITTNAGDIHTLETEVNGINLVVTSNRDRIGVLEPLVATNTADITTNEGDITANTTLITANTGAITTNATAIGTNTTAIGDNATDITNLQTETAGLQVITVDNKARLDVAEPKITANTGGIATNASDITDLDTDITNLEARVGTNETTLATNTANINNLDARVTANEADIVTANADITALEGRDVTDFGAGTTDSDKVLSSTGTGLAWIDKPTVGTTPADEARITALEAKDVVLQGEIDTNETNIASNAGNITANENDIATNATAIAGNTADIATFNTDLTGVETRVTTLEGQDILDIASGTTEIGKVLFSNGGTVVWQDAPTGGGGTGTDPADKIRIDNLEADMATAQTDITSLETTPITLKESGTTTADLVLTSNGDGTSRWATGGGGTGFDETADYTVTGDWQFQGDVRSSSNEVHLGNSAGLTAQGNNSVAVGVNSGNNNQGDNAVAVGNRAGRVTQGNGAVSVGLGAGNNNQGAESIAIGDSAGDTNQGANGIILNATGVAVDNTNQGHLEIATGGTDGLTISYDGDGGSVEFNQDVETDGKFVGTGAVNNTGQATGFVLTANSATEGDYEWKASTGGTGGDTDAVVGETVEDYSGAHAWDVGTVVKWNDEIYESIQRSSTPPHTPAETDYWRKITNKELASLAYGVSTEDQDTTGDWTFAGSINSTALIKTTGRFDGVGAVNTTGQTTGYVLTANSATAGDYEWKASTGGGGSHGDYLVVADTAGRLGLPDSDIVIGTHVYQNDDKKTYVSKTGVNSTGTPDDNWEESYIRHTHTTLAEMGLTSPQGVATILATLYVGETAFIDTGYGGDVISDAPMAQGSAEIIKTVDAEIMRFTSSDGHKYIWQHGTGWVRLARHDEVTAGTRVVYNSLSDLGLTSPVALSEIVNAMDDGSTADMPIGWSDDVTDKPHGTSKGMLRIDRNNDTTVVTEIGFYDTETGIRYTNGSSGATYHGWEQLLDLGHAEITDLGAGTNNVGQYIRSDGAGVFHWEDITGLNHAGENIDHDNVTLECGKYYKIRRFNSTMLLPARATIDSGTFGHMQDIITVFIPTDLTVDETRPMTFDSTASTKVLGQSLPIRIAQNNVTLTFKFDARLDDWTLVNVGGYTFDMSRVGDFTTYTTLENIFGFQQEKYNTEIIVGSTSGTVLEVGKVYDIATITGNNVVILPDSPVVGSRVAITDSLGSCSDTNKVHVYRSGADTVERGTDEIEITQKRFFVEFTYFTGNWKISNLTGI